MKNRTFYQHSIILWAFLIFLLFLIGICLWVIIESIRAQDFDWIGILCSVVVLCGASIVFFEFFRKKIVLTDKEIVVKGDKKLNGLLKKIQNDLCVQYIFIKDIYLRISDNDSNNKPINTMGTPIPYLVILNKGGEEEGISLLYYSKKQTIDLIDEIIARASANGNELNCLSGEEIVSEFLKKDK